MRAALVAREISSVYRLLRRTGVSQRQIAALTGQSQSEVSEILKGRQVMAYDVLVRIADGLGVPRGYMGLAYDEATTVNVVRTKEASRTEEDESVKRRKFLAHVATVAFGAHKLDDEEGENWATRPMSTPAPARIGTTDVRQIEAVTKSLRSLDYQYGGGFCRDAVIAQLSWGKQLLSASASDVVRKRLLVALADLNNLAGWTSFDVGLMDPARNYFGKALELAKAGENETLVANILYRIGRLYLHQEMPGDALKMFQLGQIAAQESGSELAVSVICGNQAWAYAMMNLEAQAMKSLGRCRDEWTRANMADAPDWTRFFIEPDVWGMVGTVHTELAFHDPKHTRFAIPALERSIDGFDETMSRNKAFNLGVLATNHLLDGDIEHGAKIGHTAVDLAANLRSTRVKDRMKPLELEARRRSNNGHARDLAETIEKFRSS